MERGAIGTGPQFEDTIAEGWIMTDNEAAGSAWGSNRRWTPMTRRAQERVDVAISDRTTLQWISSSDRWSRPVTLLATISNLSETGASLDIIDETGELPDSMRLTVGSLECFVQVKGTSDIPKGRRLHVQFETPDEHFQSAVNTMIERINAGNTSTD